MISEYLNVDALEWLADREPESLHAVVTDPPYGLREYDSVEQEKMRARRGGVWRHPPALDGARRRPVPRFTTLTARERAGMEAFFSRLAGLLLPALVPGAHVFVASNPLVSHLAFGPLMRAGFEGRGGLVRVVHTLRGGDRPKNAHAEFADVTVMPKSCYEPWGIFRKPLEGSVADNLRKWGTGGLRRPPGGPFRDMVYAAPARGAERSMSDHPSLKPQALMRHLVRASLPLGRGGGTGPVCRVGVDGCGGARTLAGLHRAGD